MTSWKVFAGITKVLLLHKQQDAYKVVRWVQGYNLHPQNQHVDYSGHRRRIPPTKYMLLSATSDSLCSTPVFCWASSDRQDKQQVGSFDIKANVGPRPEEAVEDRINPADTCSKSLRQQVD